MAAFKALSSLSLILASSLQATGFQNTQASFRIVCKKHALPPLHYSDSHSHSYLEQNTNVLQRFRSDTRGFSAFILKPFKNKSRSLATNQPKAAMEESGVESVAFIGIFLNSILVISKLIAGAKCNNKALIADATYSMSSLRNEFSNLWSVRFGRLAADKYFPFAHGKPQAIGRLLFSSLLMVAGICIGSSSLYNLVKWFTKGTSAGTLTLPVATMMVSSFSIVSKEWLCRKVSTLGEKIRSPALILNARHHRRDVHSSIMILGSIVVSSFPRLRFVDYLAALRVALALCSTSAEMLLHPEMEATCTADDKITKKVTPVCMHTQKENENTGILSDSVSLGAIKEIENYLMNEIRHDHRQSVLIEEILGASLGKMQNINYVTS